MYKKTITYTDYDGNERTEEFYFNLSKAELLELELKTPGTYTAMLEQIIKSKDTSELVMLFKDFITRSYGKKSPDGRRFIKNDEVLDEFMQTEAYTELFMELSSNADSASEFINGIMPKLSPEQQAQFDAEMAKRSNELGLVQ